MFQTCSQNSHKTKHIQTYYIFLYTYCIPQWQNVQLIVGFMFHLFFRQVSNDCLEFRNSATTHTMNSSGLYKFIQPGNGLCAQINSWDSKSVRVRILPDPRAPYACSMSPYLLQDARSCRYSTSWRRCGAHAWLNQPKHAKTNINFENWNC